MSTRRTGLGTALACLAAGACGRSEAPPAERPVPIVPIVPTEPTAPSPQPSSDSNARMARRLRAIADGIDPTRYPYDNAMRAEMAWVKAQEAPPGPERFQLLLRSALELVRAGSAERALERTAQAEDLLRTSGETPSLETRVFLLHLRALASLRLGEQENCLLHHGADSCIVPIRASGVHEDERGSRGAIAALSELLELDPESTKYRWLLNLAYMTLGEYPDGVPERFRLPASALESEASIPRFQDVASAVGVGVVGLSGGAVLEDLDGDGRVDVMASSWGLRDPLRFFRQREDGSFEERTEQAGLAGELGGLNLSHADYDNDGDFDVLVLRGAWLFDQGNIPNSLLRNDGGTFVDVTELAGLLELVPSHAGSWCDFDGDGWLDLFVGNEPSDRGRNPSRLYQNQGDGTFADAAREVGLEVSGIVKAGAWGDYDDDGRPDLYVSRFGEPNLLFRNAGPGPDGGWRFEDVTARAGVAEPRNSFPAWFFDYDEDGRLDVLVASFGGFASDSLADFVAPYFGEETRGDTCRLYRNRGDGTFEDVSRAVGLDRTVLAMGANFGDIDNDGWLDVYFGTGEPTLTTLVPNLMFRNDEGRRFQDVTSAGGFGSVQKGHGVAFGDVDGDGDQDVYVTMGGAYSGDVYPNLLFENPGGDARWITLRFHGVQANRAAFGARVTVIVERAGGDARSIHRVVGTGGSFGSSTAQLEIGLGDAVRIESLEVLWPASGKRTVYRDVPLDAFLLAREDRPTLERIPVTPVRLHGTAPAGEHDPAAHGGG